MSEMYMQTGEMAAYQAGTYKNSRPWTQVTSQMAEGKDFATKDAKTSQAFQQFGRDANDGLLEYTYKARANRINYITTEQENSMYFDERIEFSPPPEGQ